MNRPGLLPIWAIVVFVLSLVLNTRRNDFPYYYHPDEPGKVEQVMEGQWNFHHPMLLLGTVRAVVDVAHPKMEEQTVVEIGRTVSAIFMGGAIVAFTLLAWFWRGWPASLLTGALLLTHHQLFELSHYFKEDSALLIGMGASALALAYYADRPSVLRALGLGAACGLAISGKYLGAVMLLMAIPVLIRKPTPRGGVYFAVGLVVVILASNWPILSNFATFRESFDREMVLVVKGQGGATQRIPHAEYWTIFRDNTTPVMWVLLAVFIGARWKQRHSLKLTEWMLVLFPFVYALALSFSPKTNDRYFLPATAWFTLFAAFGASDLAAAWNRRGVWLTTALLVVLAQFPTWSNSHPGWLGYDRAFAVDDNTNLIDFLRTQVPKEAVLLKDNRIALPDPEKKKHAARAGTVPQKVIAKRYAADAGEFSKLAEQGITHVIVSESDYGKFFRESLRPQKGEEASFARRRKFYSDLFAEAEPIWEAERGTVIYLHPGIRVFRLR